MRNLVILLFLIPTLSFATIWGKNGHRVTGHIAQKHLSKKAKKAINALLEGNSLAFASTYADEIKSDASFSKYYPWHYVNYPLTETYNNTQKSEEGDIIVAINNCIRVLKNATSSKEDKVFYLKLLIHFIGDLHQPMHAGREEDRGGNDIQVQWFGQGSNLHKVWDTNLIESYKMSYYELGDELDNATTKKERKTMQEGTVVDWLDESHAYTKELYGSVTTGKKLGYSYSYKYNPILFEQLKKGGFRLAKILNEVFS